LHHNKLTYFVDYDILQNGLLKSNMQNRIGLHLAARPSYNSKAFVYYKPIDFLSDIKTLLHPNETVMIEIKLKRFIDAGLFRIENTLDTNLISKEPIGKIIKS